MSFRDDVRTIAADFEHARSESLKHHPLARLIREHWPSALRDLLDGDDVHDFRFVGSPGQGQWSAAPWLAVLHPSVTSTAMAGFYPVYLFEPGFETVCLVMGQGAQQLREAVGRSRAGPELARRAELLRKEGGQWRKHGFSEGPFVTLKFVTTATAEDYGKDPWSNTAAFGKRYQVSALPSDAAFAADLRAMLDLYSVMAKKPHLRFAAEDDVLTTLRVAGELPDGSLDGAKKLVTHKQFERRHRNRKLIEAVKKQLGSTCQGCKFKFVNAYGSLMESFVEAHHTVPLSTLPSSGAVLKPTEADFMVLCSNCHRAIHRAGCPSLEEFRKQILGSWRFYKNDNSPDPAKYQEG